ncbi:MAG: beta-galactosidase [Capsulimonadaceae bacterium]|nr:beta-galactosidase [Capsulimonadaceae bacterium]
MLKQFRTILTLLAVTFVSAISHGAADQVIRVDAYGQNAQADWPGKVHNDGELASQRAAEAADWKAHPIPAGHDKWGGWASGPKRAATGFFRTEQVGGKWWLVDPGGRLFVSVGVNTIQPSEITLVAGRESLFSWLPASSDPLSAGYGQAGKTYDFYKANLARKYGADHGTSFGDVAVSRLGSWGFNTIANWSVESIGRGHRFPYVAALSASGQFAHVPWGQDVWGKMTDPFDPAFAAAVDESVRAKALATRDDPACIGYFFDNELKWGGTSVDFLHYALCYGTLALGADSPAKRAFSDSLRSHYVEIGRLNAAWGTSFSSWEKLAGPLTSPLPAMTDARRSDFSAFLSAYAEKYFSIVAGAIKRYDPNHLYLGCRYDWFTRESVETCAKYADVLSFNIYNWDRSQYAYAETLGKPCLVSEFSFGALDRGMFSGGPASVASQAERGARYSAYVTSVLSEPAFVGVHWFQYSDEPTTGRCLDGENFNLGFVSITDTPFPELIAAARATNASIYSIHSAARPQGTR